MALASLMYWRHKAPEDNLWRPRPGGSVFQTRDNLPALLRRMDLEATVVDAAPIIAGAGSVAYLSQAHQFGLTQPASIFKNVRTLTALHRAVLVVTPLILVSQGMTWEYRQWIPRWAHERERYRDEEIVRQHVDVGMAIGAASWMTRLLLRFGPRYWAPIEVVMSGALADALQREYLRAHGF